MELSSAARNGVFVCLWVLAKVWLMQGETFCWIQSAQKMMDTRLICFFPEDLRLTKKDFAVFHHVPNQQQDKVVDCHWLEGEMYCSLEPGYEYVQTATSNFSVRIRHVSGKHVGLYECRLNGSNGSDVRQCKFSLKPGPCVLELVTSDWLLSGVCNFTGRKQVADATTCTWVSSQREEEGSALLVDVSTGAVFAKICFFSSVLMSHKDGVYSFTVQLTIGLQYEINSISIGRPSDVYTTCPRYVAEGENVRCECSVRHPGYPPALTTWDTDRAESTLTKLRVTREEDSTVLGTCYVVWPNHNYPPLHQLTHTLRVAYGPERSKMAIEGPREVFADGSRKMALTCKVDDVNPAPEITWSGVTCEESAAPGQCVFVPHPAADGKTVVSCTATNVHNNGRLATTSLVINLSVTPSTPLRAREQYSKLSKWLMHRQLHISEKNLFDCQIKHTKQPVFHPSTESSEENKIPDDAKESTTKIKERKTLYLLDSELDHVKKESQLMEIKINLAQAEITNTTWKNRWKMNW
ncbi:uncharacterized protein LOC112562059 isoform X2 [Pomacea canaliculata]|uniref:uncharacterized protein LOC112562059 isoform X2 n=1 Tax=Pomacea canaliculata TaxID=400727 RepID=UPI000D73B763|nr:uncharacterized protein LOC112562059 isoform X2 [Pomacea canaliculata]